MVIIQIENHQMVLRFELSSLYFIFSKTSCPFNLSLSRGRCLAIECETVC